MKEKENLRCVLRKRGTNKRRTPELRTHVRLVQTESDGVTTKRRAEHAVTMQPRRITFTICHEEDLTSAVLRLRAYGKKRRKEKG